MLNLLLAGQLDGVIGRLPSDGLPAGDLVMVPLYRDEVCLVGRPGHPILQEKRITLKRLAREQWALQRRDFSVRLALADAFSREGVLPPDPAVETATYIQNTAEVADSSLLRIAPRRAAKQQQALGQIAILDFKMGVKPTQVCMLLRSAARHNAMLDFFRQALIERIGTSQ